MSHRVVVNEVDANKVEISEEEEDITGEGEVYVEDEIETLRSIYEKLTTENKSEVRKDYLETLGILTDVDLSIKNSIQAVWNIKKYMEEVKEAIKVKDEVNTATSSASAQVELPFIGKAIVCHGAMQINNILVETREHMERIKKMVGEI